MKRSADNPVVGVLGIIRRGDRLLIIQRSKRVRAPLTWCFPGGHIEPGETQAAALVRELQEELHLDVEPGEHLTTQTKHDGRLILHCWSATIIGSLASRSKVSTELKSTGSFVLTRSRMRFSLARAAAH